MPNLARKCAVTKHFIPSPPFLDQLYQELQEEPSYNDMRAEAAVHAKMRAESFQKAAHARTKKQFQVALYYAQQVSEGCGPPKGLVC